MAYYIIGSRPDVLKEFEDEIPFLSSVTRIADKSKLANVISSPGDDPFFFILFSETDALVNDLVLTIRQKLSIAKIIYVVDDEKAQELKSHQLSPVGGDAYVAFNIEADLLHSMIETLIPPTINQRGNRLESDAGGSVIIAEKKDLVDFKNHPKSMYLDAVFAEVLKPAARKPLWQSTEAFSSDDPPEEVVEEVESTPDLPPDLEELSLGEEDMSDKDKELSLDDLGDLELGGDEVESAPQEDGGLDFSLDDDANFDLASADEVTDSSSEDSGMDLDLDGGFTLDDGDESAPESEPLDLSSSDDDLSFSLDDELSAPDLPVASDELSLDDTDDVSLDLGSDDSDSLSLSDDDSDLGGADIDLSDDALDKLKEIDAIMEHDASQVGISLDLGSPSSDADDALDLSADLDSDLDTSLVGDDLDLGSLDFANEEVIDVPVKEEKAKKKPAVKETKEAKDSYAGNIGNDLKEISGAYSGEMERLQATISNLRSDREELLARITKLEEDRVIQNRGALTMRAELDEKKIELSIIRKKLNDEITELKDRLKLFEEKKMILEEKNKVLLVELDKAGQKNKIDVKKVQMRERELEQKLELLKADSETQIRHRDLKILELKRKLDAMEFDIESISVQEKRSVESRFELEDKLDKAIKTLRNAITVLEDESEKSGALEALKKNIDM